MAAPWDRTLFAVGAVVIGILALQELWLDLTCAVGRTPWPANLELSQDRRAST